MKIKQTKQTINIFIKEDSNTFYYLKSLIDKNFKHKIGNKNKIIIFNDPDEEVSRRYFLKLLSKIYVKKTEKKLKKIWQIEKATKKVIKITLLKTNQIQKFIKLYIHFNKEEKNIEIKIDNTNRLVLRVIQNIFCNYKVLYHPSFKMTCIQNIDLNFIDLLKNFVETKEIFGNFIDFEYETDMFDSIKEHLQKTYARKKRGVYILLDNFYKKLHCNCDDSYEKVRKNYLSLIKKYHPDTASNTSSLMSNVYNKKFQEIQQAYKTIKEYHKYISNVA